MSKLRLSLLLLIPLQACGGKTIGNYYDGLQKPSQANAQAPGTYPSGQLPPAPPPIDAPIVPGGERTYVAPSAPAALIRPQTYTTDRGAEHATPYASGKRADADRLAALERGEFQAGQSTKAMRGLLGSPHSVASNGAGGVEYFIDPHVPSRLVGIPYGADGRWTGKLERTQNTDSNNRRY